MTTFRRRLYLALFTLSFIFSTTIFIHPTIAKSPVATPSEIISNRTTTDVLELGRQQYQTGQYSAAIATLEQAVEQAANEPLIQATALTNLALAQRKMGFWDEAQSSLEQAENTLQTSEITASHNRILAQIQNTYGNLYLEQSKFEPALSAFEQAEALYQNLPLGTERSQGLMRSQINQSKTLQVQGFHRLAVDKLKQLEEAIAAEPDEELAAIGLRSLGEAQANLGEFTEAEEKLNQSIALAIAADAQAEVIRSQLSLGHIYHTRWQNSPDKKAVETQKLLLQTEQAYNKVLKADPPALLKTKTLLNLFQLNQEVGLPNNSLKQQIETALATLPVSRSSLNAQIKFIELQLEVSESQTTAASLVEVIGQAQQLQDIRATSYAFGILGKLYEQSGQWQDAKRSTEQALAQLGSAHQDMAYQWQWQMGRILRAQGDRPAAMDAYDTTIEILNGLRSDLVTLNPELRFNFRQSIEPIYREAVSLLFEIADESGIKATDKANPEYQKLLQRAQALVESLQVAELVNFFRADCVLDLQTTVDNALQTNEALLYPILLGDRVEILLSRPNQPIEWQTAAQGATKEQIENTVQNFQFALSDPANRSRSRSSNQTVTQTAIKLPDVLPSATKLYDWLIRPFEATLEEAKIDTLVFALDGKLRNVPMAALYDAQKQEYLIEKYAVALTPGLQLIKPESLADKEIQAVVGALSEARFGFSALDAVKEEVIQIQQQVGAEVLLNETFKKSKLEEAVGTTPFPIVHLATHGKFSSSLEETFILAWDEKININELSQLLQSSEFIRGGVPIELLILSACETATGDEQAALGLAGVAVQAGARSTIASLWKVNDAGTAVLMSSLYEELGQLKTTKAMALREAQLKLLQEQSIYSHPYFWAPFVLVGNWL